MTVVQAGVAKSGNYWLYRIIQGSLRSADLPHRSFIRDHPIYEEAATWDLSFAEQAGIDTIDITDDGCFLTVSSAYRAPITDLGEYFSRAEHVWTHSGWCIQTPKVLQHADKAVYLIRDPRDAIISMSRFAFTDYMQRYHPKNESDAAAYLENRLYSMTLSWIRHVAGYLRHAVESSIHVVFYERLLHSFDKEYETMLDYLELDLSAAKRREVADSVAFKNMRRSEPSHVRRGRSGQWQEHLTDAQIVQISRMAEPMLRLLSYPLAGDTAAEALPSFPEATTTRTIDAAVRHSRGTLRDKWVYANTLLRSSRPLSEKIRLGTRFLLHDRGA